MGKITGFLEIQRWELASEHGPRGNPSLYTGEAAFGVISLLRRPFAPIGQLFEAAIARMEAMPKFLARQRETVRLAPEAWIERALDVGDDVEDGLARVARDVEFLEAAFGASFPDRDLQADS